MINDMNEHSAGESNEAENSLSLLFVLHLNRFTALLSIDERQMTITRRPRKNARQNTFR